MGGSHTLHHFIVNILSPSSETVSSFNMVGDGADDIYVFEVIDLVHYKPGLMWRWYVVAMDHPNHLIQNILFP